MRSIRFFLFLFLMDGSWLNMQSQSPLVSLIRERYDSSRIEDARRLLRQLSEEEAGNLPQVCDIAEAIAFRNTGKKTADDFLFLRQAYESCALLDPENKFDWLLRRAMLILNYPEYFPGETEPALRVCLSTDPRLCPLMLIEELLREEIMLYKKGKASLNNLAFAWADADGCYQAKKPGAGKFMADILVSESRAHALMDSILPDCSQITEIYGKALAEGSLSPSDARAALALLFFRDCPWSPFSEALFQVCGERFTPAWWLGKWGEKADDPQRAAEAFQLALQKENHPGRRGLYWLSLADAQFRLTHFKECMSCLDSAAAAVPGWGLPYLRMAELLVKAAPSCSFEPFTRKAVYWLATDYCREAANRDPEMETEAAKHIYEYSRLAPTEAECRIRNLRSGDTWPLGCWIERVCTVRY